MTQPVISTSLQSSKQLTGKPWSPAKAARKSMLNIDHIDVGPLGNIMKDGTAVCHHGPVLYIFHLGIGTLCDHRKVFLLAIGCLELPHLEYLL